jgi:hypothetical protein
MEKLTKHQRHYRKRKQQEKRDFVELHPESPQSGIKVNKRSLCVRVNLEASQRLLDMSEKESTSRSNMLSRVIIFGLAQVMGVPAWKYKRWSGEYSNLIRYKWDKNILNAEVKNKKTRAAGDSKQLNLQISSTAWKKLQCASNDLKFSKARIVQTLILNYKPTPIHVRLKRKKNDECFKIYRGRFFNPIEGKYE